ncbi:thyroid hormone receptor beta-A-like isoform X2 [Paramacrobiotus metropolitanus]|uniref:thyroid hormone receptor beta-A-like isoform X2 n=1 Tax=Paramacrobiotus metropolitanus TaxID=2943436 RepID=UPI0024461F65|nr:thyroid hormone receptor beta-A-like isoform X2 [Paramacrobiotus metropolitanus]
MSSSSLKKKRSGPYIPSYMDLSNGPEPCAVCGDAATGYHYRCMTCEGCKGFFRRTTQKNLKYMCKDSGQCPVDKQSRNQCPQCRYQKCLQQGMAIDLVLSENQRVAKRQLIEENRERRELELLRSKLVQEATEKILTDADRALIREITEAYRQALMPHYVTQITHPYGHLESLYGNGKVTVAQNGMPLGMVNGYPRNGNVVPGKSGQLLDLMAPAIRRLESFSLKIPGFSELTPADRQTLLKSSCVEMMLFRTALRFDRNCGSIILNNGFQLNSYWLASNHGTYDALLRPLYNLGLSLAVLFLDEVEVALLLGLLLLSGRPGVHAAADLERQEEIMLTALRRYLAEKSPKDMERFTRLLMKVLELRTISAQNADKIMFAKLESLTDVPAMLFATMFEDTETEPKIAVAPYPHTAVYHGIMPHPSYPSSGLPPFATLF